MTRTQMLRPTLLEAAQEAAISPDTHWTSQLSTMGMTRIKRTVVLAAWAPVVR